MENLSQILIVLSIEINCALLFSGEVSLVEKVKLEESEVIFLLTLRNHVKHFAVFVKDAVGINLIRYGNLTLKYYFNSGMLLIKLDQ